MQNTLSWLVQHVLTSWYVLCSALIAATSTVIGCGVEQARSSSNFYDLLNRGRFVDYEPLPIFDLARSADVVAIGAFSAVRQGRTYGAPTGSVDGQHTSVIEMVVDRVLPAGARERMYFEVEHSLAVRAEELMAKLPTREAAMVLLEAVKDEDDAPVFDSGRGVPRGETLHVLAERIPQSLIVETSSGLSYPLDHERIAPQLEYASLDELFVILNNSH